MHETAEEILTYCRRESEEPQLRKSRIEAAPESRICPRIDNAEPAFIKCNTDTAYADPIIPIPWIEQPLAMREKARIDNVLPKFTIFRIENRVPARAAERTESVLPNEVASRTETCAVSR
jgi:hypothetical protein